jgi:phosphinothricin acetyltransferase
MCAAFPILGDVIRLATKDDVETIRRISNDEAARSAANFSLEPESAEKWRNAFDETHEFFPWIFAPGGFAKAGPWRTRDAYAYSVEISVYLEPAARGRGLGTALYERLFAILRAQGYHTVVAGITLPNEASVRLHESFGMRKVAHFEDAGWKFGQWWSVGYWQAVLHEGEPDRIRPVADVAEPESR